MKIFSLEEANALLPTVQGIAKKIQRSHRHIFSYQGEAKQAAESAEQGGGGIEYGADYARLLVRLTSLVRAKLWVSNQRLWPRSVDFPRCAMDASCCFAGNSVKVTRSNGGTMSKPAFPDAHRFNPLVRTLNRGACLGSTSTPTTFSG
jgi:hypothetical protein